MLSRLIAVWQCLTTSTAQKEVDAQMARNILAADRRRRQDDLINALVQVPHGTPYRAGVQFKCGEWKPVSVPGLSEIIVPLDSADRT